MSTRATYEFEDEQESYTVYKHHDGYPEGAIGAIRNAIDMAWPLPRFEADDFAAAFVAANKPAGGGKVYLTGGKDSHGDTEYHYVVTFANGELQVSCEKLNRWNDNPPEMKTMSLDEWLRDLKLLV